MSRPPERFLKYSESGDYHWRQYDKGTKYKTHADRVQAWIAADDVTPSPSEGECPARRILDIGAGDGKITSMLGPGCIGIDNEPAGIICARKHGVDVEYGDAYNLPWPEDTFDSVLMADVLEHFEFPEKALAEARRVLKRYLYITTPPKRPDGRLTDIYHFVEWTPQELVVLVESCGFKIEGAVESYPAEKIMYGKFRKI